MRIFYRGIALGMGGLSPLGGTIAAPLETVLHRFDGAGAGAYPFSGPVADATGALYGVTAFNGAVADGTSPGHGTIFKLTPPAAGQTAWTHTVLHSFCAQSGCSDGDRPYARLMIDAQGALYGTTFLGGIGDDRGHGTVFKLAPPGAGETAWTHTVLYRFQGGGDGSFPAAGLIADERGALYGTTLDGGIHKGGDDGCGVVFKLTPPSNGQTGWTESVLYRFHGESDGCSPDGSLIADGEGTLYGTTSQNQENLGNGTVFKLSPPGPNQTAWTETILYHFTGGRDGRHPQGALIADGRGALYGATFGGGNASGGDNDIGNGAVFRLAPPADGESEWRQSVLHRFEGGADGAVPARGAGLFADDKGAIYGATLFGGLAAPGADAQNSGFGTIFKLTPPDPDQTAWTETILYRFQGGQDGASPDPGFFIDARGRLYGATGGGGGGNFGTVFKLDLCPEPMSQTPGEKGRDLEECPVFRSSQTPFPTPATGKSHFVYRSGADSAPAQSVPDLSGISHRLTAEIETSGGAAEGVIVAKGGREGGYSLYLKDGKLAYESNVSGKIHETLVAPLPLPPGKVRVGFAFDADRRPLSRLAALLGWRKVSGTGRLLINGVEVAQAPLTKLDNAPTQPFTIGKDIGSPVSAGYRAPFAFTGKIEKVEIEVEPTGAPVR